ncbi:NADP-dependent malic enzyme [Ammoniphilus sp. CFH 90114]|uniref:NAD(P)-dependent malic enzyme n=1 Tax=Ammoniphilus sp. CFH 90114 TaxID=2493665 RepID=UPI00100FF4EF|nr:malic enzyme-like NAD(P)-binding protein [Ammoniphilus sp. CFH 90114]RXT08829.1 NAD-dependent malic enzyme [Ammoniphilus sp. CFH 90114]
MKEQALELHFRNKGKLEVKSKISVKNKQDLSLAYSPGVAEPCKEIYSLENKAYDYTMKGNTVAVISNGTAVLGLGNIGALASLPVLEGKAMLFKEFANVDAFPVCINTTDIQQFVNCVKLLEPTFGAINLEDIAAPHCFTIEEELKKGLKIPVFHDDQHGTAIVVMAGLINSLKITNKEIDKIKVVVNGAGAAGVSIVRMLHQYGVQNIIMCDSNGAIYDGRIIGMNGIKEEIAKISNIQREKGNLSNVIGNADVFIGVSVAGALTKEMIRTMSRDPIVFALANPTPEIMPEYAKEAGARVVATGRSDYPNQINNVLAFPAIFRGALDVYATQINEEMKIAAVSAIAELIKEDELSEEYIIPCPFDPRVVEVVSNSVSEAAVRTGVSQKNGMIKNSYA